MFFKRCCFVFFVVFFSFSAFADKYTSPKKTSNVEVKGVEVLSNGDFRITSKTSMIGSGCFENETLFKVYAKDDLGSEGVKSMLSVVMLAYSLNKPIRINHDDSPNCLVDSIQM
ncbi:hypothetical protein [Agaribacterium sp. ZY112]|uniref:hypothetical protein n=1 Tax=Agaribacterium sp. ZY112 TaxID=3233574 RepID=UPI003523BD35